MRVEHNKNFYVHLIIQAFAAVVFMYLVLFFLDYVRASNLIWAVGASTLASTSFIVFVTPHKDSAKSHRIIIGYAIAMLCGHFVRILADHCCSDLGICHDPEYMIHLHEVAAVISLAFAFFLMALLRSSHPPAAGLAIVMVIDLTNFKPMIVIGIGAIVLASIIYFFKKHIKRLI